jgi:hypothetical protein
MLVEASSKMASFDGQPALQKIMRMMGKSGDIDIISQDPSPFTFGSFSLLTYSNNANNIWVIAGNQPVMGYWKHNFDFDTLGNVQGRNEADACSLWLLGEDNTMRYFGAPTGPRFSTPTFTLYKTFNLLTGAETYVGPVIPSQTVGITGTTTNNSAQAGAIGEVISATIATPGTSLTTATPANVITTPFLALTAGDWDVWGEICFLPAATTSITQLAFGLNSVSATLPAANSGLVQNTFTAFVPTAIPQCDNVTARRVSLSGATTYYLVAQAAFTVSTLSAFGTLYARRRR